MDNNDKALGGGYVLIQFGLIGILFGVATMEPTWIPKPPVPFVTLIGRWLCVISLACLVLTVINFGQVFTPNPVPKEGVKLKTKGMYAVVRHPMYFFIITLCLGYILYRQAYLTLILEAALIFFFDKKTKLEEYYLVQKFPEYKSYQSGVKRLIPFIY